VRLEENYRSSPQVLALANRLVPRLGGAEKTLRATRPEGPEPELRGFDSPEAEGAFVLDRVRALRAEGVAYEEMAVLMRLNARSVDFEELFADAGIPFQGAALLSRDGARQLLKGLRGAGFGSLAEEVRRVARQQGLVDEVPDKLGERELVRQADLARLCKLAEEFDDGTKTVEQWIEWLRARFAHGAEGGVHLLTLHRAKGLEFEAVFLPRIEEKELPCKSAMRAPDQVAEERRLLYVGMTRAKRHLALTWAGKPSRFLLELGVEAAPPSVRKTRAEEPDDPTYVALKEWRLKRSKADEIPAYVVFHNSTLAEIASRRPQTIAELASVPGVGPAKLERYGRDVLEALAS
jgi:DNA helicase-2/ATP-dependent DNA helicase PcrA